MSTAEAYDFVLKEIDELKESGINIVAKSSISRNNKQIIKRCSGPENIPPDAWVHITFLNLDEGQAMRVHEAANYLGMCGIYFDTGGCSDYRDWELDWSFKYTGKIDDDKEVKDLRNDVEDIINNP